MNGMELNSNRVASPNQAVEEYIGEQFLEWLQNFIAVEVKSWPELAAVATASPKIERVRKFMLQYFLAAEAFLGGREGDPGFLGFALANLSESNDPLAEAALEGLEKKQQEELSGDKRMLWLKLLHALGLTDEEIKRAEPKEPTRNYVAELSDVYSNLEWQTAMGAFAAHERSVVEEGLVLLEMLSRVAGISGENYGILKAGPANTHVLDKIVFDQENKRLVWEGVKRQLDARHELYKGLSRYLET
ncbi:MAG: hypothetical protein HYV13_02530 [Candidatus Doudnabacteria bacterium]|nr:hypothetical protein [Candidatus Doudnabacteria bacterium]